MPLNEVFKALSDATRRQILNLLQKEDLTAGDIANHFDMTKPSISHHLNILKQANLVQDLRKGQYIYYSLNTTVFQEVIGWFYDFIEAPDKSQNSPEGKIDHGQSVTEKGRNHNEKKITLTLPFGLEKPAG